MDLLDVLKKAKSTGKITGPGNGVSDEVPAMTNGGSPVQLSEGEYVIRADAVSNLGGGATDPGVKILDELVQLILKMDRETAAAFGHTIVHVAQIAIDSQPKIDDSNT